MLLHSASILWSEWVSVTQADTQSGPSPPVLQSRLKNESRKISSRLKKVVAEEKGTQDGTLRCT